MTKELNIHKRAASCYIFGRDYEKKIIIGKCDTETTLTLIFQRLPTKTNHKIFFCT